MGFSYHQAADDGPTIAAMKAIHNPADHSCVRNTMRSTKAGEKCDVCAKYDNAQWLTQREIFIETGRTY